MRISDWSSDVCSSDLEQHFVEIMLAGHADDWADGDARCGEVHDQLAETGVPGPLDGRGADEGDDIVDAMGVGGPDFTAVDLPAAIDLFAARLQRGEVGAGFRRIGRAHV